MRNVALDLGNRISFAEVANGKVVKRGVVNSISELEPVLGSQAEKATVAFEACREAWHLHDILKRWGHEPVMVDTTRARQMGIGHHKKKNDRIDAETLARALEERRVPRAHVLSPGRRAMRELLNVRRHLTTTRASFVAEMRGLLRAHGLRLRSCGVENFVQMAKAACPEQHRTGIAPLFTMVEQLDPLILDVDAKLEMLTNEEPAVALLKTTPGVGTVVSTAFISVVDNPSRFKSAHQVEAYLGLVPSENSSGRRRLGGITKQGNSYARALLVQAAWSIIRTRGSNPLKVWALAVAKRRAKKQVAAIALARRLAGVLWAMWRDGTVFEASRVGERSARGLETQADQTLAVAAAVRRVSQDKAVINAALKSAAAKTPRAVRRRMQELITQ